MYTIKGRDDRAQYTLEQLRGLIAQGVLDLDCLARAEDTGEWKKLREYPELLTPDALTKESNIATFTVEGSDGKRIGPLTPEQVKESIAQGRFSLDSFAKGEGHLLWKKLREYPEISVPAPPPVIREKKSDAMDKLESIFRGFFLIVLVVILAGIFAAIISGFFPGTGTSMFRIFLLLIAVAVPIYLIVSFAKKRSQEKTRRIVDENTGWISRAQDPALVEAIVSLRTELKEIRSYLRYLRWSLIAVVFLLVWIFHHELLGF
jgi:hypothetical protein